MKMRVPRVEWDPEKQAECWYIGDQWINSVGVTAIAGWKEPYPSYPPRYEQMHPGSYDAHARLRYMDEQGIWAMVLYPNVGGFGNQVFGRLNDPEAKLACVHAYNDFLIDWSAADSRRLIPVMTLPIWDVSASVKEIERCAKKGHRGVVFTGEPQSFGLPLMAHKHWDPIWAAAEAHDLPISFHIGSGDFGDEFSDDRVEVEGYAATSARAGAKLFMTNGAHVLDLLFSGILVRYPKLRFVSVESGIGWIPFILEALDYQLEETSPGTKKRLSLKPSEYFRRQGYGCFWFERVAPGLLIESIGVNNVMFETDFPHPTCLYPDALERGADALAPTSAHVRRRVLQDNAAELYRVAL
jgi:predicted TIM-barrel fold metal-dependent hydrolase